MAARAWAAGGLESDAAREQDGALADAAQMDLPAGQVVLLERLLRTAPAAGAVWLENVPIVAAFLRVASQWRTAIGGVDGRLRTLFVGLDYAGAKVALDAAGVALDGRLLDGLQVMETAAAAALNGQNA